MIIYLILLIFLFCLWLFRGKMKFIDMILLYCLFYDITIRFAGKQGVNYSYVQPFIILVYVTLYIIRMWPHFDHNCKRLFFYTIVFLILTVLIPVLKGASLDSTLRIFAVNSQSILILPIAYHYYSTAGDVENLFKIICYVTILWVAAVVIFTILKIDVIGTRLGSEDFGLGLLYFGEMSNRGAISYISLLFIASPIILLQNKGIIRILLFISIISIFAVIMISLKRFSVLAIGFAIVNLLFLSGIKLKRRYVLFGIFSIVIVALLYFTPLPDLIVQSYYHRGAEEKVSIEAVQEDVRLYEPIYVFEYALSKGIDAVLFGSQTSRIIDISSQESYLPGRNIHNQYAQFILVYGIIGLIFYLMIFITIYRICSIYIKNLKNISYYNAWYWLTFQNILFVFIISGMVGGHIHPTYRSIVMMVSGGIAGYFTKQHSILAIINNSNYEQIKLKKNKLRLVYH